MAVKKSNIDSKFNSRSLIHLWFPSGPSVPPVHWQQRSSAAERTCSLSDQQPRAAVDGAAVWERPEPAGARGECRPAVLFGLYTEHTGGAAHHQHAAGGEEKYFTCISGKIYWNLMFVLWHWLIYILSHCVTLNLCKFDAYHLCPAERRIRTLHLTHPSYCAVCLCQIRLCCVSVAPDTWKCFMRM